MTTAESERPIVVGIFRDRALAEQAIDELRHAGFRDDQIRLTGQGATAGGLLETLKSKFSGQGTTDGHLYDDLVSLGVPEEEAHYYQRESEVGHTIVLVQSYGHQQEARNILHHYGAYDASTGLAHMEQIIPLRGEQLQAHKQPVEVGEIRLRKKLITEEQTITVSVTREEIVIERVPIADQNDPSSNHINGKVIEIGEGETIRIPLRAEQVTVVKQPVVIEEIIVGKRQIQETQRVSDTIRREEPYFQRIGDVQVHAKGVAEVPTQTEIAE